VSQDITPAESSSNRWLSIIGWVIALGVLAVALFLTWRTTAAGTSGRAPEKTGGLPSGSSPIETDTAEKAVAGLPGLEYIDSRDQAIFRRVDLHTIVPNRPRQEVRNYTVRQGDSVFEIAQKFNISPETLLWANYDLLNDNPDMISVGMELKIPPVNGVYYQWEQGDTVESVAAKFEAKVEDILAWSGNDLDLTDPEVEPSAWVMVPDGHREFRQWVIPVIPRGRAGVSRSVYGAGACEGGYSGAFGSGTFIWPAGNHTLSGNDFWSGHLGIDIAAGEGAPIYASDAGVVVFAGWATGGYGNMIMIDHGNGYQTLYAHMSKVVTSCGRSVGQGSVIGYSGSTGNSTGSHLHFEVRFQGGFVSPWNYLP
jgi:murein DD-endopeptidase MepM/ murein hydrolase activator NlpD